MELRAFIVHALDKNGGEIDGEVRLQKLVYFCKALGANLNVHYGLSINGPFSWQVTDALQDCVMDEILRHEDGLIQKGDEFDPYMDSMESSPDDSDNSLRILEDVLSLCLGLSLREMEITATIFFIKRFQAVLFGCHDKDVVIEKAMWAKGGCFSRDEIEVSYQRVSEQFLPLAEKYAAQ